MSDDALSAGRLVAALGVKATDFSFRLVDACGSTNSELIEACPADDGRVHVLVAGRQTAGRGRRGRPWLSFGRGSLTFSALWRFAAGAPVPAGLSLVAGLGVARWLEGLGVEGVQLKWPNDVLVFGRKLAGILVELVPGRGRTPAAVIGIGLNLSRPPDGAADFEYPVAALADALPDLPGREALLADLLVQLDQMMRLYAEHGFEVFQGAWMQRNAFADLPVVLRGDEMARCGICRGVDVDGALLLEVEGRCERVLSGEVSLRVQA